MPIEGVVFLILLEARDAIHPNPGPRMNQELSMFDALIGAQLTRSDPDE
jgi:hypothetical protein